MLECCYNCPLTNSDKIRSKKGNVSLLVGEFGFFELDEILRFAQNDKKGKVNCLATPDLPLAEKLEN